MPINTPRETLSKALAAGQAKITLQRTSNTRLFAMALAAGCYIALGALLSVTIGYGMPQAAQDNPAVQKILSGLTFPIGLLLIVCLGGELFTGNNALLIPGIVSRRYGWRQVAWNWTLVWLANFAGCLLVAAMFVAGAGAFDAQPWHDAIAQMAQAKVQMTWWTVFFKAVGANWCVCLAVWLALTGKTLTDKTLACWIPVMAFVALGFEHCIANMFFIPAGMYAGAPVTIGQMFTANLIPATLGNIAGGALLVGTLHTWLHKSK